VGIAPQGVNIQPSVIYISPYGLNVSPQGAPCPPSGQGPLLPCNAHVLVRRRFVAQACSLSATCPHARVLAAHACPCSGVMCVCQRIAMCAVLLRLLLVTTCACLRRVQRPAAAHRRDAHRVQQPAAGAPPQCSQAARPPCGLTLTASISCTAAAVSYRRSGRKQAPIQALQPAGASSVCHPTPILTLC